MPIEGPSRRAVLVGGLAVAGALTGCLSGSGDDEPELTRGDESRLHLGRIVDEIELLAAQYDSVQLRFPDPTGMLVLFAAEHRAHVAARSELSPGRVVTSSTGSGSLDLRKLAEIGKRVPLPRNGATATPGRRGPPRVGHGISE